MKKIIITGLGSFNALGNTFKQTWINLKNNHCAINKLPFCERQYLGLLHGGFVKDLDDNEPHRADDWLDRSLKLAKHSLMDALQSAQLNPKIDLINSRVMIVGGTALGGCSTIDKSYQRLLVEHKDKMSPYFNISSQSFALSAYVARLLKALDTTGITINASCATGVQAIQVASERIQQDLCDLAVVTVSETPLNRMVIKSFQAMRALSDCEQSNAHNLVRPFNQDRSGFALAEGAATLILESQDHALKRKAPHYGQVLDIISKIDQYHWTSPHPEGHSILACMKHVLKSKKVQATGLKYGDDIYINAHGTATKLGDQSEAYAFNRLSQDLSYKFHISSTKGHTGHMLSTTGLLEVMFSLFSLRENIFIKTRNLSQLDPEFKYQLNFGLENNSKKNFKLALSNSIGFGGFNSCIALQALSHSHEIM